MVGKAPVKRSQHANITYRNIEKFEKGQIWAKNIRVYLPIVNFKL